MCCNKNRHYFIITKYKTISNKKNILNGENEFYAYLIAKCSAHKKFFAMNILQNIALLQIFSIENAKVILNCKYKIH